MTLPIIGRRFRNAALLYGLILFAWIRIEDFQTLPVVIFGTTLAGFLLVGWLLNRFGGKTLPSRFLLLAAVLAGAVLGLSAVIATTLLMFFKTASHAHIFPDYPPLQMLAMLERAPAWTAAGALLGLAAALLGLALRKPSNTETPTSTEEPA
ncbi:MAG: hypothetical protein U0694_23260 [Anaerolineae bacterium]